jgi:hypothetical protein
MIDLPGMTFVTWNYDMLQRRVWDDGDVAVTIEPTGEVYWARFESNPAYYCGQVIVQGFEDFERDGPPVACSVDCDELRAYLGAARRPGTSTHLLMGAEMTVAWRLDGRPLAMPYVPGPEGSGVVTKDRVSWRRAYGPHWARVLVTPGAHVVDANGLEIHVAVDANSQCTVLVEADASQSGGNLSPSRG